MLLSKRIMAIFVAVAILLLCVACNVDQGTEGDAGLSAALGQNTQEVLEEKENADTEISIEDTMTPLAVAPAISTYLAPVASGKVVDKNAKAEIDASNTADGYIMIKYTGGGTPKLKVIVTGPSGTAYTYDLRNDAKHDVFPLSDGNGTYKIGIYQNVSGTKYSTLHTATIKVQLKDEFAPFLRPNQYVNFTDTSKAVKLAGELTTKSKTELEKVEAVYEYVIKNFTYDKKLAESVQSGYIPNIDTVLAKKTGICFDYAALMTAMLRSQGIPTKLVIGYAGNVYHAWINVYTKDSGWVDEAIFFDGNKWKIMDPTFASSGNSSSDIAKYIGTASNYTAKYLY